MSTHKMRFLGKPLLARGSLGGHLRHMDDLRAMRTFLKVAELKSFAGAGRALGRTPTAVTRSVAGLEKTLGVQLLIRTTRAVSLTSAGAAYAARIAPLIAQLDGAATDLRVGSETLSGEIRLNAPQSLGVLVLPQILAAFKQAHPEVSLRVTLTDRFVDILRDDFDLAVRISSPPQDKSTIWRKICHVERLLVAAPDHPATAAKRPEDLRSEQCLGYGAEGQPEIWALSGEGRSVKLRAGLAIAANSGDLLAEMAADGAGVALLPRFIVDRHLAEGRLAPVLPSWRPPDIWLTLYYPPYVALPRRVAVFSDFFETHLLRHTVVAGPGLAPG